MILEEKIKEIEEKSKTEIDSAKSTADLEQIRIKYLGRKGEITVLVKGLKDVSPEDKPKVGKLLNELKSGTEESVKKKLEELGGREKSRKLESEIIDVTLPAKGIERGRLHPITKTLEEVMSVFKRLGYSVVEGPDAETDYYNFEALNFPKDHPAREMHDTFYLSNGLLLRTHTSPVQIRVMEKEKPPVAVIVPGRVYRRDADITHSAVFHQLEGFLVDKNITFGDLKGTLIYFLHEVFGKSHRVRFRPSFFPFTEPSAEVDVECIMCNGRGCRTCSNTGWLEILGAGMIDPNVFKYVGYDSEKYTGLAFGMGIERIAMLKYGIDDIRLFFENDMRFLRQF